MSWFAVEELGEGVHVIRDPGYARPSLTYLVEGTERAALIDTGLGMGDIRATCETITDLPVVVLQTHAHPDHAGGSHAFDQVRAHPRGIEKLQAGWSNMELRFDLQRYFRERTLPEGISTDTFEIQGCKHVEALEHRGVVDLGERQLDVFFTPGHSPDSVSFLDLERGLLFTGDSIVKGHIAVENASAYRRSLDLLSRLANISEALYPAHGEIAISADFVGDVRRGFVDAVAGRAPTGFLAGFATYEFGDFGIMLPPRSRRLQDQ